MTKFDYTKFAYDLRSAEVEAENSILGKSDGGTFNFDSVALFGIRWSKKIEGILHGTGHSTTWLRKKCILITPPGNGSAGRRTEAARVMTEALKRNGWDAVTYYQMD